MNLFGVLDVSGSALTAERLRAEVIAVNMANAETTRTAAGGPYVRKQVVFQAQATSDPGPSFASFPPDFASFLRPMIGQTMGPAASGEGVRVAAVVPDQGPALKRYDPGHPDADKDGFVAFPNINPLTEMVDLMGATRAYGLNSSAIQATKSMISASLDLLK